MFRTKPLYADWFSLDENKEREDSDLYKFSIMSPPGTYKVTLKTSANSITKPLKVIKDPNSEGTLKDISLQNELVRKIYDDINLAISHINSIETIRRQLLDFEAMLKSSNQDKGLIELVNNLEEEFLDLEKQLIQLKITGTGQDSVRYEKMILEKLRYLANTVQISDFKPADSYGEVYIILKNRLERVSQEFDKLKNQDLVKGLNILKDKRVEIIITD